jgi:pyruvate formate lyase activating enzyme
MALIGREITAGEAIAEVLKDEVFYSHSGGGLTLSGGEPFFQGAFALALLRLAKERNLHACAETCGAVPWETLRRAAEFTDIFLYDVKETSAERHRACTGAANGAILSNLEKLDAHGARIVLRCPIVPGLNDREDHFAALGALAGRLRGVERVDIEPYHPLGLSKAAAIGKPQLYEGRSLTGKDVSAEWARKVERHTDKPVAVS